MKSQRRRDTGPELAVRRLLHRTGFRFRVDAPVVPTLRRRADIAFPRERVAVFVDGCFWHGCPLHGTTPRANRSFWVTKIVANQLRDRHTDGQLAAAGWVVVRSWEHEDAQHVASRVGLLVRSRRGLIRGSVRPA